MAETITRKTIREKVAGELGLIISTVIDVDADPNFTIAGLIDYSPDVQRMHDAFLHQAGVWRRIVDYDNATGVVTVTRTSAIAVGACEIYSFLDPDDMNGAINEALQELYFEDVESISLVADTKLYSLPTWMQHRGQFISLKWRDIVAVTTDALEDHVQSYTINEDNNALTVMVHDKLRDITTYDLRVAGRRNYTELASEAATTTCPRALIIANAKVKVLHRIMQKFGKSINTLFGPKMMVAERELITAKSDWLPKLKAREFIEDEFWSGPDTNEHFEYASW